MGVKVTEPRKNRFSGPYPTPQEIAEMARRQGEFDVVVTARENLARKPRPPSRPKKNNFQSADEVVDQILDAKPGEAQLNKKSKVKKDKVKRTRAKAKAFAAKTIADADNTTIPEAPKLNTKVPIYVDKETFDVAAGDRFKPKAKAKAKLLAMQDKPAASSEGTKGATKRNKGKQADVEIEEFKKLNKKEMIVVIQDEIPNPRKPTSLNKMTEQQIVAYVAERLGKKKQRRNKNTQSSLLTA